MDSFRLDRSAFKGQTAEEAAKYAPYYATLSWKERLSVAAYLNSIAYNYPLDHPPKMDKTKFKVGVQP